MPRPRKTPAQASSDNAKKFNARQRAALPLFMGAGLEAHLLEQGHLRDRAPDHQLRLQRELWDRLAAHHDHCRVVGEALRHEMKAAAPETYRQDLLRLRYLRSRFDAMRTPTYNCDFWRTALCKALPVEAFHAAERRADPTAAQRQADQAWVDAQVTAHRQASQARATVQPTLWQATTPRPTRNDHTMSLGAHVTRTTPSLSAGTPVPPEQPLPEVPDFNPPPLVNRMS